MSPLIPTAASPKSAIDLAAKSKCCLVSDPPLLNPSGTECNVYGAKPTDIIGLVAIIAGLTCAIVMPLVGKRVRLDHGLSALLIEVLKTNGDNMANSVPNPTGAAVDYSTRRWEVTAATMTLLVLTNLIQCALYPRRFLHPVCPSGAFL